ncbi:cellulose biosynthesis protein [Xanthomonas oryzae pv. oryzicola]|nr:cellulose biosynthesis protein [Xanthomonas oryzae pv. oryzicola]PUE98069.1 cellulose biosynthesis protein [Xanthomonas oryzae pv. oryzicola]
MGTRRGRRTWRAGVVAAAIWQQTRCVASRASCPVASRRLASERCLIDARVRAGHC